MGREKNTEFLVRDFFFYKFMQFFWVDKRTAIRHEAATCSPSTEASGHGWMFLELVSMRSSVRLLKYSLTTLFASSVGFEGAARADLATSVSTNLQSNSHSSVLSLDAEKKFSFLDVKGDLSNEIASTFKNPQNAAMYQNGTISVTFPFSYKPMASFTGTNSTKEKSTTVGGKTGLTLPLFNDSLKIDWTPAASIRRTTLKAGRSAAKNKKNFTPAIDQIGLEQSLTLSFKNNADRQNSLSLLYHIYDYPTDLALLKNILSKSNLSKNPKKKSSNVSESLSVFSKSLLGMSLTAQVVENLELKADFYQTVYELSGARTDYLISNVTYTLSDELDVSLQSEILLNEPRSEVWTVSLPYALNSNISPEIGASWSKNETETPWSLLISLGYSFEDDSQTPTAESRIR
ncbi:MAG: hypothetical protein RL189_3206 [Pseudomonadota bacterium]|jgi:hypothetical protein